MIVEFVCALVSATLLAACWVPCCLVMCGCAKPEVSSKTIQIPFFYFSPEISKPFRHYFYRDTSQEASSEENEGADGALHSNMQRSPQKLRRYGGLVPVESQCLMRLC